MMGDGKGTGSCIFCSIASREVNAKIAGESGSALAFHDINPQSPLHLLIIPKAHISSVSDLADEDLSVIGDMMSLARDLAKANKAFGSGYRLVVNNGYAAGQTVFHLHMHLLAGRHFSWPPG